METHTAPHIWSQYNVVLVTIDSCRFDTLSRAHTPNIDRIAHIRKAETFGLFTLPAHMSIFCGYPPNVVEAPLEDYYSRERFQIWRLARGKWKNPSTYGLLLAGATLIEGYRRLGYYALGVGGVRWFLSPLLTNHFDEFCYWGPNDYLDFFRDRTLNEFALEHVTEIVDKLRVHKRWLLFVNCIETHAPYDTGIVPLPRDVRTIIDAARPLWAGKTPPSDLPVSLQDFSVLHEYQVRAAEVVDSRLGQLFRSLSPPYIVYICGDHGECFGEDQKWGHGFHHQRVIDVPVAVGFAE